jgi:hypothetical protein
VSHIHRKGPYRTEQSRYFSSCLLSNGGKLTQFITSYNVQTHPICAVMSRSCHPVDLEDNHQHHRPWACAQKNPIFTSLFLHSNLMTYTTTSLLQWERFRKRHRHWLQILKTQLNIALTNVRLLGPIMFNCKLRI